MLRGPFKAAAWPNRYYAILIASSCSLSVSRIGYCLASLSRSCSLEVLWKVVDAVLAYCSYFFFSMHRVVMTLCLVRNAACCGVFLEREVAAGVVPEDLECLLGCRASY